MKRLIGLLCAIGLLPLAGSAFAAPVVFSGTGHAYEVVSAGAMTFDAAKSYAASLVYLNTPGHLVSITSAEEQAFVASLGVPSSSWIGGFQADTSNEPAGGWTWIDGEPWSYTSWGSGEPNNAGGAENCAQWWSNPSNTWNDIPCGNTYNGMVVEYDLKNVPVPMLSPLMLSVLVLLLLAGGYTLLRYRRT